MGELSEKDKGAKDFAEGRRYNPPTDDEKSKEYQKGRDEAEGQKDYNEGRDNPSRDSERAANYNAGRDAAAKS